ncbi:MULTISPECIES: PAS domain S-box protein [unclassified Luteibacter]|jgi:PAS domain S-box-containing protein|uniref:PAS domain S-box protein n=1 Tax=Luteibacter sp. PvP019 TaxID=3156436 RepID=UPI003392A647
MSRIDFDEPWTYGGQPWRSLKDTDFGVIVVDAAGAIVHVNDRAAQLHGWVRLAVIPEDYSRMYGLFTEEGRPYPSDDLPLTRSVQHGETIRHARWVVRRPDGSRQVMQGTSYPVCDRDGDQVGAVLVHDAIGEPRPG